MSSVLITKNTGKSEPFDPSKLVSSLKHAGASDDHANKISLHIQGELREGMTTDQIYRHAFDLLRISSNTAASKYSMKRAVSELGPDGFAFEKLLAEIWKKKGYEAVSGQIVQGSCVEHEVDLVAWKEDELIMAEAKFHNEAGIKSDLKTALYVKARLDDLKDELYEYGGKKRAITAWYLITNTKFTDHATRYAKCKGLNLIAWNYPQKGNLEDLIIESGVNPITCLITLSTSEKKALLNAGIVICKDIIERKNDLIGLGVHKDKIDDVVAEAHTAFN